MAGEREIEIVIKGKNLSGDAFNDVNKSLSGMGEAAQKTSGALDMAFGVLASTQLTQFADTAGRLFTTMLSEAGEAQSIMVQLEQVIKSTGGAAGLTADDVAKLAGKWADLTVYEDDAIVAGQTLLLQFNNINKTNLDQATGAMVDLATRMGVDLPNAARILGRALEGQMAGLSRYGIVIDEQTQANIKSLMDQGKTAEATALILDAIGKKTGGAAEAQAKTWSGLMERVNRDWNDFLESIGKSMTENEVAIKGLDSFDKALQRLSDIFSGLPEPVQVAVVSLVGLVALLGKLAPILITLSVLGPKLGVIGTAFTKISTAVGGLPALLVTVGALIEGWFIDKLGKAGAKAGMALAKALNVQLHEEFTKYQETLIAKGIFSADTWAAWIKLVKKIVTDYAGWISNFKITLPVFKMPTLATPRRGAPRGGAMAGIGEIIPAGVIDAARNKLLELQNVFNQGKATALSFITGVSAAFASLPAIIGNVFTVVQTIVLNFFTGILAQFTLLPKLFQNAGISFQNFGRMIESAVLRALAYLRTFVSSVQSWLAGLANRVLTYARDIGTNIVNGIWQGISTGWEWLKTQISNNMTNLLEWVKNVLGIQSPSKVFAEQIGLPIAQGIGEGVRRGMGNITEALGTITAPTIAYASPIARPSFVPAPAYARGYAPVGASSYRVDVGRIEIHGSLSEGERRYFDKRSENIAEKALLKVLK